MKNFNNFTYTVEIVDASDLQPGDQFHFEKCDTNWYEMKNSPYWEYHGKNTIVFPDGLSMIGYTLIEQLISIGLRVERPVEEPEGYILCHHDRLEGEAPIGTMWYSSPSALHPDGIWCDASGRLGTAGYIYAIPEAVMASLPNKNREG